MNQATASSGPSARPSAAPLLGRIGRLIRKELNEILRDRRTIMTLILMPILLYPLLSLAFQQLLVASAAGLLKEDAKYRLFCPGEANAVDLYNRVYQAGNLHFHLTTRALPVLGAGTAGVAGAPLGQGSVLAAAALFPGITRLQEPPWPPLDAVFQKPFFESDQPVEELLRQGKIDVVVRPLKTQVVRPNDNYLVEYEILYLKGSPSSLKAVEELERRMTAINAGLLLTQLPRRDGPSHMVVLRSQVESVTPESGSGEFPLAAVVPLILILMTVTGAVYPAIDLTAGERERGTLEVLVAAPVPRLGLLFAKYVSVLTVAMLTALINLVMMTLTIWLSGLGEKLFGPNLFSPLLVIEIFGLLLFFAAFFAAVLLTITSFARSFKEAQAYLIPLMLVSLAPGLAGMIPGLRLSPALAMVPLLNIVLLGRDLFEGSAALLDAGLVVGATLIYAAAALSVAARVFGAEDVLYNEQTSWTELFRRPAKVRPAPSLSTALACLCLIFFITFVVRGLLAQALGASAAEPDVQAAQMLLLIVLAALLFAGLPYALARLRRIDVRSGLLLQPAPPLALVGAFFLGVSLWPLILELQTMMNMLGWTSLDEEQQKKLYEALQQQRAAVPAGLQIALPAVSALVEEVFFRGFLFAALLRVVKPWAAVLLSAFLFAAFHVAATPIFGLERFLPSFLLGLALGWVCWRSQSLLPPMLFHLCHDALLAGTAIALGAASSGDTAPSLEHLPALWLVPAAVGTAVGVVCLLLARRPRKEEEMGHE